MSTAGQPLIIGINGLARSGKDTIGQMLVARHGFTRVAFADGIRDAALALDPLVHDDHLAVAQTKEDSSPFFRTIRLSTLVNRLGWDEAKALPEVRRTLQRMGSEAGWMLHGEGIWIRLAEKKITGPTVITDVRFAHEVRWLDQRGGLFWRVKRPGNTLSLTGATAAHASETSDLGREPDSTIVNGGTLEDLARAVDTALTSGL